jgi:hypothetical protein
LKNLKAKASKVDALEVQKSALVSQLQEAADRNASLVQQLASAQYVNDELRHVSMAPPTPVRPDVSGTMATPAPAVPMQLRFGGVTQPTDETLVSSYGSYKQVSWSFKSLIREAQAVTMDYHCTLEQL